MKVIILAVQIMLYAQRRALRVKRGTIRRMKRVQPVQSMQHVPLRVGRVKRGTIRMIRPVQLVQRMPRVLKVVLSAMKDII